MRVPGELHPLMEIHEAAVEHRAPLEYPAEGDQGLR